MEPNKYDIEMLKRVPRFSGIIESVENNDTVVSVNEPDQNMLNFMSAKGYILVNCVQFGSNEEGMGYDCLFKRTLLSCVIQGSNSGRLFPEEKLDGLRNILKTPGILKRSSEYMGNQSDGKCCAYQDNGTCEITGNECDFCYSTRHMNHPQT